MYDSETLILSGVIALIVGVALGILFTKRLSADSRKQRDLERSVDQLLQQQKDYQHQVVEHFTGTAALLNNLAESYRDVHNHLAKGATALCADETGSILRAIPDTPIAQITGEPDPASVQPPLDYAPKASPYATGVLNEEFGLNKRDQSPEDAPQAAGEQPAEAPEPKTDTGKASKKESGKASKAEAKVDAKAESQAEAKEPPEKPTQGSVTASDQDKPAAEEAKGPSAEEKPRSAEKKAPTAAKKAPAKKEKAPA